VKTLLIRSKIPVDQAEVEQVVIALGLTSSSWSYPPEDGSGLKAIQVVNASDRLIEAAKKGTPEIANAKDNLSRFGFFPRRYKERWEVKAMER
jgi:hypothetical protein